MPYDSTIASILCRDSADVYLAEDAPAPIVIIERRTDTVCMLQRRSDEIVIAFRGTADMRNWMTDVDCRKVRARDGMRLHEGFFAAWDSIQDDLIGALRECNAYRTNLVLTGHSLGGALAMLAAYDLADDGFNIRQVYTFGQPRVGDASFATHYNAMLGHRTFRVVRANDIVPRVPWCLGSFRHAGTEVFYEGIPDAPPFINPPLLYKLPFDLANAGRELRHGKVALLNDHHVNNYLKLYQGIETRSQKSGIRTSVPNSSRPTSGSAASRSSTVERADL